MTGFLESLSGGFVVLVILSLLAIAVGFLWDSTGAESRGAEPVETPPPSNLSSAIWDLAIAALWGYFYLREDRTEPDWLVIGLISLFALGGLYHLYKYLTVDLKAK